MKKEKLSESTVQVQRIVSRLIGISSVLDSVLGDTDPFFDDDITNEEIKNEEPIFWACLEINKLIQELSG